MSNQAALHQFITKLARSKRVLLVGNDFELLQLLAMTEVTELIICDSSADPNAPDGVTPLGSLLRFRADTKERPRSKDLIIDLSGVLKKAEVERLLKKSGQYICTKKRRFAGFSAQPIETRPLQASIVGSLLTKPVLAWSISETSPSTAPNETWWLFTREDCALPNLVIAHDWGNSTNPEQTDQIGALEQDLENVEKELEQLKGRLIDLQREQQETALELKRSQAHAAKLEAANQTLQVKTDQLNLSIQELEQENDELSSSAARLKADENRFVRLEERFESFRAASQTEIEGLESELRALASPGQDRQVVIKERDALKKQIVRMRNGFDDLFTKGLAGKKLPKIPPLEYDRSEAPFDLWLDKTALLLRTQQSEVTTLKSVKKKLQNDIKRLEKQLVRAQAKTTISKPIKPLEVNISAVTSSDREGQLQTLLEAEIKRNTQLEKSFKVTLKRVTKVTEAFDALRNEIKGVEVDRNTERGHRLAAEADQKLLRQELTAMHRELEERGTMLDTYASLQELLSNSLNQAEEARLDAEDARRLADENLRILQDEYERLSQQGLSK